MVETSETIFRAVNALRAKPRPTKAFVVMQSGYQGERQVFETDDELQAEKVAGENPARRIVKGK